MSGMAWHDNVYPEGFKLGPIVSVGAIIAYDSPFVGAQILMVHQKHKTYPDLPGGIVEPGEHPIPALYRELDEELGIKRGRIGRIQLAVVDSVVNEAMAQTYMAYVFLVVLNDMATKYTAPDAYLGPDITRAELMTLPEITTALDPHAPKLNRRIHNAFGLILNRANCLCLENGVIV